MGEGKLDRKAVLKTSLPEKGASYIRELGGSLFLGKLDREAVLKTSVPEKGASYIRELGGSLFLF